LKRHFKKVGKKSRFLNLKKLQNMYSRTLTIARLLLVHCLIVSSNISNNL